MAAFFSFGSGIDVDVRLADEDNRQFVEVKGDTGKGSKGDAFAGRERCPVYLDGEAVKGQVRSAAPTRSTRVGRDDDSAMPGGAATPSGAADSLCTPFGASRTRCRYS